MTEREEAMRIAEKYHGSLSEMSEKATAREFKAFMMYVANQANRLQRQAVGLED